jgi:hypothetical protein
MAQYELDSLVHNWYILVKICKGMYYGLPQAGIIFHQMPYQTPHPIGICAHQTFPWPFHPCHMTKDLLTSG